MTLYTEVVKIVFLEANDVVAYFELVVEKAPFYRSRRSTVLEKYQSKREWRALKAGESRRQAGWGTTRVVPSLADQGVSGAS